MHVEGKGRVAPGPVRIVMDDGSMRCLLLESQKRARFRGYKNKPDAWSQGLRGRTVIDGVGVIEQDVRPILAGLMGEEALRVFASKRLGIELKIDLTLRPNGDGGTDLEIFGVTHQVKTRQSEHGSNLIRLPFKPVNAFVFCEWLGDKVATLLGWCMMRDLEQLKPVTSHRGDWKNLDVPGWLLSPMCQLIDGLEARKLAGVPA